MYASKHTMKNAASEALKVIAAAALLAAYATLAHWSHSDRTMASQKHQYSQSSAAYAQHRP